MRLLDFWVNKSEVSDIHLFYISIVMYISFNIVLLLIFNSYEFKFKEGFKFCCTTQ